MHQRIAITIQYSKGLNFLLHVSRNFFIVKFEYNDNAITFYLVFRNPHSFWTLSLQVYWHCELIIIREATNFLWDFIGELDLDTSEIVLQKTSTNV